MKRILGIVGVLLVLGLGWINLGFCADAAVFVSETYKDNTILQANTSFTKTWTLKNVGNTTWNSNYKLKYVSGNLGTNHNDISISGTIAPDKTYTFSVPMKAPSTAGPYREDWKLVNSSGTIIKVGNSDTIWALIKVEVPSDITPPPHLQIL